MHTSPSKTASASSSAERLLHVDGCDYRTAPCGHLDAASRTEVRRGRVQPLRPPSGSRKSCSRNTAGCSKELRASDLRCAIRVRILSSSALRSCPTTPIIQGSSTSRSRACSQLYVDYNRTHHAFAVRLHRTRGRGAPHYLLKSCNRRLQPRCGMRARSSDSGHASMRAARPGGLLTTAVGRVGAASANAQAICCRRDWQDEHGPNTRRLRLAAPRRGRPCASSSPPRLPRHRHVLRKTAGAGAGYASGRKPDRLQSAGSGNASDEEFPTSRSCADTDWLRCSARVAVRRRCCTRP